MQKSYSKSSVSRRNIVSRNSSKKALIRNISFKASRNTSFKTTRRDASLKAVSRNTRFEANRNASFKALNCKTSQNASFGISNLNHYDYNACNNSSFGSIDSNNNNTRIAIKNPALHQELYRDINLLTIDDSSEKQFLFNLGQERWSAKIGENCCGAMSKPTRRESRDSMC